MEINVALSWNVVIGQQCVEVGRCLFDSGGEYGIVGLEQGADRSGHWVGSPRKIGFAVHFSLRLIGEGGTGKEKSDKNEEATIKARVRVGHAGL